MSAEASSLRRWPEAKVIVLLIAAIVLYARIQIYPLLARAPGGPIASAAHANDFKHLYLGSWLIANDVSPYDRNAMLASAGERSQTEDPRFRTILPYVYLPFTGVVLRPLASLQFPHAVAAFQIVNHIALMLALGLLAQLAPPGRRLFAFSILLFALSLSAVLQRQNNAGQLNVLLLLGYALVAWATEARTPRWTTGLVAAFAALFKLSPGILGVTYLLRRRWFDAGVMTAAGIALLLGSFLFAPPDMYLKFLPELRDMSYGHSTWADLGQHFWRDPYNQSINAFLHRTLVYFEGSGITPWAWKTPRTANHLTIVASLAILGAFACACFKSPRTRAAERAVLAAAITASLLLPSLMWDHYLVQLAAPVGLLLWPGDDSIRSGRMQRVVAVISIVVAVIAALWIQLDAEQFRSGIGLAVMSLKLWPVLAVFVLAISCALAERPRLEAAA
jgi:hypothetical protein